MIKLPANYKEARAMHNAHAHREGVVAAVKGAVPFDLNAFTMDDLTAIIEMARKNQGKVNDNNATV